MAFVAPENLDEVLAVAGKWEIDAAVVGEVKPGGTLRIHHQGKLVAEVPAASLADDAPLYERPFAPPADLEKRWATSNGVPESDPAEMLLRLLDDPGIGSAAWIYEQYDHMLFLNTVIGPGSDGSLLRIKGTTKGLAVSTDGNGFLCSLDPRRGAARIVWEAALNVAVTGARPLAVVDNLNFGNPEKPEVMWQFRESVEGISEACEALGIPVVGGNVSFYNETDGADIYPTPVVGLLGLADPMPASPPRLDRVEAGMEIWEIGPLPSDNLAGSYVQRLAGVRGGRPTAADPEMGRRVVELAAELAHRVPVLHDISDGGLAVAVAETCIASGVGATLEVTTFAHLFGEAPHRFIAVAPVGTVDLDPSLARRVGVMGGTGIAFGGTTVPLGEVIDAFRQALPRRLGG